MLAGCPIMETRRGLTCGGVLPLNQLNSKTTPPAVRAAAPVCANVNVSVFLLPEPSRPLELFP